MRRCGHPCRRRSGGDFTLPVTGFAAGDSAITVTCTYTYLENGVPKRIQSSTIISARSLRDAVGLVYDVEEDTVLRTTVNGVYLPCEGTRQHRGRRCHRAGL